MSIYPVPRCNQPSGISPAPPLNFFSESLADRQVLFGWQPGFDGAAVKEYYIIQTLPYGFLIAVVPGDQTRFNNFFYTPGVLNQYYVLAVSYDGFLSAPSNESSIYRGY